MAAIDVVNRVFREFRRYTGDGLPGAPTGAPLPVGDPSSGVHSPKKSEIREALLAPITEIGANIDAAFDAALRAENARDEAEAIVGFNPSDMERDIFLDTILNAKALGYRQAFPGGIADGFGGSDGINALASSGYVFDPTGRRVLSTGNPSRQIDTIPAVALSVSDGGWANNTMRQRFDGPLVQESGSAFRILFKGGSSGAVFSSIFAGHAAAGAAFTGNQVPVTFAGGAISLTLSPGEQEWSDWITYAVTAGTALLVSAYCSAVGTVGRQNPASAEHIFYYKSSADAGGTAATGFTEVAANRLLVEEIEVQQASTVSNIVLTGLGFDSLDAVPASIKGLLLLEPLDAATLNTDVTMDVSRDDGATWSSAVLTQVATLGTKVLVQTSAVNVTGQPSGSKPAHRYKTLNGKRVHLHGVALKGQP